MGNETRVTLPAKNLRGERRMEALEVFAKQILVTQEALEMKISARGWGYELEGQLVISKDEIDLVESLINECRRNGILPVDFTAEEEGRQFSGIEIPEDETPKEYMKGYLEAVLQCGSWYTPDWWDGEEYYIQMVVEKIDLKNLFAPMCMDYHIPIATSKGWSSIRMRAEFARRFKRAEENGLKCVLLYLGDFDPDGFRISDFLRTNLKQVEGIRWESGEEGYNPDNLKIQRFGLDYDFIIENELIWVNNLITGSGKNLASPSHKNHRMDYVQNYLKEYGVRKCEANAILKVKKAGKELCEGAIQFYLGFDARQRFREKREAVKLEMEEIREEAGLDEAVAKALASIEDDD